MVKASAKTARMTLRSKKEPMTTRKTENITPIHQMFESIRLYMTIVQPSNVIIWKIVSKAQARLSKLIMP